MLQIEAINIVIHTNTGLFGRKLFFTKGLNIVRGNNTSGKSSLFGAIIYGLGFEELLGSKNDRALQSVFKSVVKEHSQDNSSQPESQITQSEVYLQISNGRQTVTTKRFVLHDKIKPQAIELYDGPLISEPDGEYQRMPMFLHDPGSASNEAIGFHKFLEDFLNTKLPEIINQDGRRVKMYLPLIAAAHFIEQKAGWSDFYANMPYYGVRDANSRVFEYILGFSVFEIAAKRQEIQSQLRQIEEKWKVVFEKVKQILVRGGGEIIGIPDSPEILSQDVKPVTRFYRGDKTYSLNELIQQSDSELNNIKFELMLPSNENTKKLEEKLEAVKELTERYEVFYDNLRADVTENRERWRQYKIQLKNVDEDLRKNKDAEKIQNLGLESRLSVTSGLCPTCHQNINDTLLPEGLHITPMRIGENVSYLNAQKKMIEAFVKNIENGLSEKETRLEAVEKAIQNNRLQIKSLKRELTSDDRLPPESVIERKVVLERELGFLYRIREELEKGINEIYSISLEFKTVKASAVSLAQTYLSDADLDKLQSFEYNFRSMLHKFGFTSKPVWSLGISNEKYLPVHEVKLPNGIGRQVDIRFESSASDFIRAQWAYYTSLMKTSIEKGGNHWQTLIFDEPQQQSSSTENFKAFLGELATFKEQQVIVLASFQNSNDDFKEATQHLATVNIIDLAANNSLLIERVMPPSILEHRR